MANKAVFLDRDNTLIEDPGYLSDSAAVKVLPGVDLALKSLAQAGFKLVVVTNQSGVARGLLTEQNLADVHAEMRRQLAAEGAHLDAIYYCPYHAEGTVEGYAVESELRKPKPGMLLKAAEELDIDLSASWMVGDSPRDIEAGQRAGCRTIRVRLPRDPERAGEGEDEDVQADFTVRNLVDAAKLIARESNGPGAAGADQRPAWEAKGPRPTARASALARLLGGAPAGGGAPPPEDMTDAQVLREVLRHLRRLAAPADEALSASKVLAGACLVLAGLALAAAAWLAASGASARATAWGAVSAALGVLSAALYLVRRNR
jgi:D-glycero-D-manno-heptose 1,7-bisphosphate phosphatase